MTLRSTIKPLERPTNTQSFAQDAQSRIMRQQAKYASDNHIAARITCVFAQPVVRKPALLELEHQKSAPLAIFYSAVTLPEEMAHIGLCSQFNLIGF